MQDNICELAKELGVHVISVSDMHTILDPRILFHRL